MSVVAKIEPEHPATGSAPVPAAHMESVALVHMIERVARDPSIDLTRMERLIEMKERLLASERKIAFSGAVSRAKSEIKPIARTKLGHNNKRYADMAATASAVDPILSANGLGYRYRASQNERITVTCILFHQAGHEEETTLSGPADTTGNKNAIQAIGSTLTYLQRYSLFLALGLAASDDDDGKAAGAGQAIGDEQAQELNLLLTETKSNTESFLKIAGVASVPEIPAANFEPLKRMLQQKKAANPKAAKAEPQP